MRLYAIAVTWYLIGLLTFYTLGIIEKPIWPVAYYVWEKTKDLLLISAIAAKPAKTPYIKSVYVFALLRLIWEIVSYTAEWNINSKKAVGILFIILAITITYVLCKELIKWERQKLRRSS